MAARARHLLDKRPDQIKARGRLLLELADSADRDSDPWEHLGVRPPIPREIANTLERLDNDRADEYLRDQFDRLQGELADRYAEKTDESKKGDFVEPQVALKHLKSAHEAISRELAEVNYGSPRSRFDNAVHHLRLGSGCDTWYETLGLEPEYSVQIASALKTTLDLPASFIGNRAFADLLSAERSLLSMTRRQKLLDALPPEARDKARMLIDDAIAEGCKSRAAVVEELASRRAQNFAPIFKVLGAKPFDSEWTILGIPDPDLSAENVVRHAGDLMLSSGIQDFFSSADERLQALSNSIEQAYIQKYKECTLASEGDGPARQQARAVLKEAQDRALSHVSSLRRQLPEIQQRLSEASADVARSP